MDCNEAFVEQSAGSRQARLQLRPLTTDDRWVDVTPGTLEVAVEARLEPEIEHDRDGRRTGIVGSTYQRPAGRATDVRRIDDGEPTLTEPPA